MKPSDNNHPSSPIKNSGLSKRAQKLATAKRLRQAITILKREKRAEPFKTKTSLANALANNAGVSVSLLLRSTSPHSQLFAEAVSILVKDANVLTQGAAIPHEALRAKIAELENKITAAERIISDLSKRVSAPKVASSGTSNKREFELTCRLVMSILRSNPTLQFDGSNLVDYGSLSGDPEVIATSQETTYYLSWQSNVQH